MRRLHSVDASPSRKVLIVAYHFPPDAAVGAIRPAKFAKYLKGLGWMPHVLTVRENYAPVKDYTRVSDVLGVPVVRTRVWPTVLQLAMNLKRLWPARGNRAESSAAPTAADTLRRSGFAADVKRWMASILELPDDRAGWLIPALIRAYRLVRRERIELVITSSPPRTTALIGLVLSYLARVRLVTDLRDPWFVPYWQEAWFRSNSDIAGTRSVLRDRIEHWLERKMVERSALVVAATERHRIALRAAYRAVPEERFCTISNGFDSADLSVAAPVDRSSRFTISYLGTLYMHRSPRSVFEALSGLVRDRLLAPDDFVVELVGEVRSTVDGSAEALIASYGLSGSVRLTGAVAYRESLRKMAGSDLLLLFAPQQPCSIPAKAFEYLAMRRPILCLTEDGATADLIRTTDAGFVVDPEDILGIKSAVLSVFEAWRCGRPWVVGTDVSSYERAALSERLSRLLTRIQSGPLAPVNGEYTAEIAPAD